MSSPDSEFESQLKKLGPVPLPTEIADRILAPCRNQLDQRLEGFAWQAFLRNLFARPEPGWAVAAIFAVLLVARPPSPGSPKQNTASSSQATLTRDNPSVRLIIASEPQGLIEGRNGELARQYRVSYLDKSQNDREGNVNSRAREEVVLVPVSLY